MQIEGVPCDRFTFVSLLNACSRIGTAEKGQEIHAEIERQELLENDLVMGNALVDMYSQCGLLSTALQVFENLSVQNVVSWTVLIAGYAEHERSDEALRFFERMQRQGVSPNSETFICALKACANIGSIRKGEEVHGEIERRGLLEGNVVLGNCLVDMYSKCGLLAKARVVFNQLPSRDVISWTSLMSGYSQLGESEHIFQLFESMLAEGIQPNEVTFVVVLSSCSKVGIFSKSHTYFESMSKDYGISATIEHYTCVVDLFTRAGRFDKTIGMVRKLPLVSDLYLWRTILGACRNWGALDFGQLAFGHALHSEKDIRFSVLQ
jgi:pentatricopeptide repeat protein